MREKSVAADSPGEIIITRLGGEWGRSLRGYKRRIEAWCRAALPPGKRSLSVVLADDKALRALNHTFRGRDKATNVLSFEGDGDQFGDIILAYETIRREAREQKKSFLRHAAHLIVHGCLHLQGYDHEREEEAKKMEAKEKSILAKLGFPDPYRIP